MALSRTWPVPARILGSRSQPRLWPGAWPGCHDLSPCHRALRRPARLPALVTLLTLLLACAPRSDLLTLHGATMGTTWSVQLPNVASHRLAPLHADIDSLLAGLEGELSHWQPESALSRFNRAPAGTWHALPADLAAVMAAALALAEDSQGAFDPALGALVNLWGFGPDGPRDTPPAAAQVSAALARSGWQRLRHDPAGPRLWQPGGVQLDLSGIAKGHAIDRVAARLDAAGIRDYLVEIGGELRARGHGPRGRPWRVAIRAPLPHPAPAAVVELAGNPASPAAPLAVATSGSYHAGFEHGGQHYSHTLDPRTGAPVANGVLSVTVLADSAMQADALATAITVLGPEQGLAFAEQRRLPVLMLVAEEGHVLDGAIDTGPISASPGSWRALASAAWPDHSARQSDP